MNRRQLLLAASALFSAPLLRAQVAHRPVRIGVLSTNTPQTRSHFWEAFKEGMTKLGWLEDRDVSYFYRYTRGDPKRTDELAEELVAEKPDLIFAGAQSTAVAVRRVTRQIPIVFAFASEPVESGLVESLAHPRGNATGLSGNSVELRIKLLELARDLQPGMRRLAVVIPRSRLGEETFDDTRHAARGTGIEAKAIELDKATEYERAFDLIAKSKPDVVIWTAPAMVTRQKVAERAAMSRVPTIFAISEVVEAGGLLSYGVDVADNYRRAASYVDRILKGAKPGDLPVEQPAKFDLVVNLKAASAQGITIPQSILLRATRVID